MEQEAQRTVLQFYADAGVETVEGEMPGGIWNWQVSAPAPRPEPKPSAPSRQPAALAQARPEASIDEAIAAAEAAAASADTLDALITAITAFEGCPLRSGATQPVIFDGVLGADVLVVGEAPGREEDRLGKPFVGKSGQLLDRMLASIGLARAPNSDQAPVCITNAAYWRPPGNRNPTKAELATCMPFAKRFVALSQPKLVLLAGKVPTEAFFPDVSSIIRARGQFRSLECGADGATVPALPLFHPAFLLRQPAQKRWAWRDLLAAKAKLKEQTA